MGLCSIGANKKVQIRLQRLAPTTLLRGRTLKTNGANYNVAIEDKTKLWFTCSFQTNRRISRKFNTRRTCAGVTVSALDIGSGLQGTAVLSNGDDGQSKMVRYAYIGGKDLNREMEKIKEQRPHVIKEVKQPRKRLDKERPSDLKHLLK